MNQDNQVVSRMAELGDEVISHIREAERRSGDTPREVVTSRLDNRERLKAMERRGLLKLGSGKIPNAFWTRPRPEDPEGEVLDAVLDERESSR